jgi:hypothetical protein
MEPNSMEEPSELTSLHPTKEEVEAEVEEAVPMAVVEVVSAVDAVDLEVEEAAVATVEEVATTVEAAVQAAIEEEAVVALAATAIAETIDLEDAVEAAGDETITKSALV